MYANSVEDPDDLPKTSSQHKTKVGAASTNKTPNDLPRTFLQPKTKVGASNQNQRVGEFERIPRIVDQGHANGHGHLPSEHEKITDMSIRDGKYQSSSDYYEFTERLAILSMT